MLSVKLDVCHRFRLSVRVFTCEDFAGVGPYFVCIVEMEKKGRKESRGTSSWKYVMRTEELVQSLHRP